MCYTDASLDKEIIKSSHEFTDASLHYYITATYKLLIVGAGCVLATACCSKHVVLEYAFILFSCVI